MRLSREGKELSMAATLFVNTLLLSEKGLRPEHLRHSDFP